MTATVISGGPATQRRSFARAVAERYRALRQRRHNRRAMGDLRQLSNHTLKDIGLHHAEITSVVCASQSDRRRCHAVH